MRVSDGHKAVKYVDWAACSFSHGSESRDKKRRLNADFWETEESEAIEHVLHSLTSLGLAYNLEIADATLHGAIQDGEGFIQVVAIRGDSHEDCRHHYDDQVRQQGTDPTLVISRDRDNLTPTKREYSKIFENYDENGLAFLDFQSLVTACRNAADSSKLKEQLDGSLPRNRRII